MRRPLWLLATLLSLSCGPVDPQNNQNTQHDAWTPPTDAVSPQPDAYVPPGDAAVCTDVVDVVFVLDVSSSMNFVLEQLGTGIGEVVTAANGLAPDAHFGLIPFVDNHAIDLTGDLEGGKVHTQAATLQAAFTYTLNTYTTPNRNPGDGPTGLETQNPICEENAADALYAAAVDFPWRDNATRVIILATDDTFLERPDNYGDRDGDGDWDLTNFPREGNYPALRTMAETVQALQDARVRVFSFTKLEPPGTWDFDKCGTGRRLAWEAVSNGWSTPYLGAEPIPAATDGGNFDLNLIKDQSLSLSATISEVVVQSYCNPPVL